MGRLTKWENGELYYRQGENYVWSKPIRKGNVKYPTLSKLAHYEDLEEQGLLTIINNETFQRDESDRCTHRSCNNCDKYRRELQRYKDLEEQGRLIEQKHGRWIEHEGPYFKCSVCGISEVSQGLYCRNCGAKMKLKELEGDKE